MNKPIKCPCCRAVAVPRVFGRLNYCRRCDKPLTRAHTEAYRRWLTRAKFFGVVHG